MSAELRGKPEPCEGCGYDGEETHCHRCHLNGMPPEGLLKHMRGHGYEPELWPDGSVVIVDTTLEPKDFT